MELYVNIEDENKKNDTDMPKMEKRVIKLNSSVRDDEDYGL